MRRFTPTNTERLSSETLKELDAAIREHGLVRLSALIRMSHVTLDRAQKGELLKPATAMYLKAKLKELTTLAKRIP